MAQSPDNITNEFSIKGLLNTLNPLSAFMGDSKDYVPGWWRGLFSGSKGTAWNKSGAGDKLAHVALKTGAGAALLGSLAWAVRSLMHQAKINNIDSMDASATAGQDLEDAYKRPTGAAFKYNKDDKEDYARLYPQEKKQEEQKKQAGFKLTQEYGAALGVLPPAAALLAMVASYKLADKFYDKKLNKRLKSNIDRAQNLRDQLAKQRILRARGVTPMLTEAYNKELTQLQSNQQPEAQLVKDASLYKTANPITKAWNAITGKQALLNTKYSAIIGVFGALLLAGGFAGGYALQSSTDKNRAKYKAHKAGLQAYNKARLSQQNIQSQPLDPQLIQMFNAGLDKGKVAQPAQTNTTKYTDLLI